MANYEEKDIVMNEENEQPVDMEVIGYEAPEAELESGEGGGIVKAVVALVTIGAGVIALVKNKDKIADKIDARKIRKLEKKGYVVSKPVVEEAVEEDEVGSEEAETES